MHQEQGAPSGGSFADALIEGLLQPGTNSATFLALNICLGLVAGSLLLLLASALASHPWLVPHAVALLVICVCLWASLLWFFSQVGLTQPPDANAPGDGPASTSMQLERGQDVPPDSDSRKRQ